MQYVGDRKVKSIEQYNVYGIHISRYKDVNEAAKSIGVTSNGINKVISGACKTYMGYVWK